MATTIDSRVVEMRFDNQDFEKNASATLDVLKNLDKSLNGFNAVESLGNISAAAEKADLSALEKGVETVKQKFTALEVIAVGALLNIGNKAIDAGSRMLKSFTIDPIIQGWDRYAQKTSAVQTIMGATAQQFSDTAVQMEAVEGQLEKLSWFTDETSFRFVDMVDNIGKFTSAGVGLEDSVKSMQGINLWAAKSGATVEQAGRAMYNLSQAMSTGKLTIMDWKSIENANMATVEFKESAIDLAKQMGVLKDAGDGFVETMKGTRFSATKGFRDSLTEGWLNDQVMTATFNKYSEFSERMFAATEDTGLSVVEMLGYVDDYKAGVLDVGEAVKGQDASIEQFTEHLKILSDEGMEFSRSAFEMAQEAKTFREAIDYVGEAVSSGWMRTFELIFGNYVEAKELWSGFSEELYEIFVKGGEERNRVLKEWKDLGGRTDLFQGIANIWKSIKSIIDSVKTAWDRVFPPATANTLYNITKAFADFTSHLVPSETTLSNISTTFEGLFSILKVGVDIIKAIGFAFKPLFSLVGRLALAFGKAATSVSAFIGKGLIGAEDIIRRVVFALAKLINYVLSGLNNIPFLEIAVLGLGKAFEVVSNAVKFVVGALGQLIANTKFGNSLKNIANSVVKIFENIQTKFKTMGAKGLFTGLKEGFESIVNDLRKIKIVDDIFNGIKTASNTALNVLKNFGFLVVGIFAGIVNKLKSVGLKDFFRWLIDDVIWLGKQIVGFFQNLDFATIISNIRTYISGAGDGLQTFIGKIREFASGITPAKLAAIGFSLAILGLANSFAKASEAFVSIGGLANELKKRIVTPFQSLLPKISPLLQFAIAIVAVSKSLKMLSDIPAEQLKAVVASMATLTVVIGGMVGALTVITSKIGGGSKNLDSLSKMLLSFGAGIGAMAAGLALLNASGDFTNALPKIMAMMAIIAAFGTMATLMSKIGGGKVVNSIMLISFAGSLVLIMKSFSEIAKLPTEGLKEKIIAMTVIMGAMGLLAAGLGNIRIGSVIGVLLLKDVLVSLLPAIVGAISGLRLDPGLMATLKEYEQLVIRLTAVVGAVSTGLIFALSSLAKSISKMTAGLMGLALSIVLMGQVAKSIKKAQLDPSDIGKAVAFIGSMVALFGAIIFLAGRENAGKHALKLSVMIVSVGAMVALLSGLGIIIGQIDEGTLKKGGAMIAGLMGLFAVIIAASALAKDAKPSVIIAAVVGVVALSAELLALSFVPWDDIRPALTSIVSVMLSLALVMLAMSHLDVKKGTAIGVIGIVGAIAAIGASLYMLQDIPWQQMLQTAAIMSGTLLAISGVMLIISKTQIDAKNVALMGITVAALAVVIHNLSSIPWQQALGAAGSLSILLIALGACGQMLSKVSVDFKTFLGLAAAVGGVVAIVFAINQLIPALTAFESIPWESLGKAGATLLGLATGILIISDAGVESLAGAAAMMGIAVAFRVLTPALETFTNIPWEDLGKAGAVLTALSAALGLLGINALETLAAGAALLLASTAMIGTAYAFQILGPALESIAPTVPVLPSMAGGLSLLAGSGLLLGISAPGLLLGGGGLVILADALSKLNGINISTVGSDMTKMAGGCVAFAAGGTAVGAVSPLLLLGAAGIEAIGKAVIVAHDAFAKAMPAMVNSIKGGARDITQAAAGLAKGFLQPLAAIIAPITNIAKLIGIGVEAGFRDGAKFHSPPEVATKFKNEFTAEIQSLFNDGTLVEGAHVFGSKITDGISSGIGTGKEVIGELTNSMSGMTGMADSLTASFGNMNIAGMDLNTMVQSLGGSFDYASFGAELFNGQLTSTSTAMNGVDYNAWLAAQGTQGLGNDMGQTAERAAELAAKNQELSNNLLDTNGKVNEASESYRNLRDAVGNSLNIFDEFQAKQAMTGEQMITNMQSHLTHLQTWADNVALLGTKGIDEGLLQKLVDMGPAGAEHVAAFANMTDAQLAQATELWAQSLTLPDQVTQQVASTFEKLGEDINAGVEKGLGDGAEMAETFEKNVDNALKAGENIAETNSPSVRTKRLGENILEGLRLGFTGPKASQILTVIKQLGNKMVQEFTRIAREITQKFATTFTNNVPIMTKAIENGMRQCVATAQTFVSTGGFSTVGKSISEGIANGISNYIYLIEAAARDAIRRAKAAAQAEAQVNSPSKLFAREVGAPIPEGIAKGISDNVDMPVNAAQSLIRTILSSMEQIDSVIKGDLDFEPIITPKIDLSYVNSGIAAINSSFESKRLAMSMENDMARDDAPRGDTITFNQYNNSPKALSRLDIYRNTKNLLSTVRA